MIGALALTLILVSGYPYVPNVVGPEAVLKIEGLGDIPLVSFQVTPPSTIEFRGPSQPPYEGSFIIDPATGCSKRLSAARRSGEVFKNAELDVNKWAHYTFHDVTIASFHGSAGYPGAAGESETFTIRYASAETGGNLKSQGPCDL